MDFLTYDQDVTWEPEQCPVTKSWYMTKEKSLPTFTVYRRVGPTGYQTPILFGLTASEAETYVTNHNMKIVSTRDTQPETRS